ncbi:MAG: tetratricopeptide repeat protein, partial [Desulfobacterales bacterium]|nr:tetratricopeptide repeat protein [Desulfobacterales bacterium]
MKKPQATLEFIAEQKKILADNSECASSSYNLGVGLMEQGKLDEAIGAFNDAIADSGRMFEGWVNLGYIYFKKGDLNRVIESNLKAIEIEPRYARGYANLGFAYLQTLRTQEA